MTGNAIYYGKAGEAAAWSFEVEPDNNFTRGVSPPMFRRTVATVIDEEASLNLASELLGHTDPRVTIEHCIRGNEQVIR